VRDKFAEWLLEEIDRRNWSQSELARRAELAQPTISLVLSEQKNPGPDFCQGVARAFRVPTEVVFRRAGLLPPEPDHSAKVINLTYLAHRLHDDDLDRLLVIARALVEHSDARDPLKRG
jgi:transcriptional regulator with XRE-family HTH domain